MELSNLGSSVTVPDHRTTSIYENMRGEVKELVRLVRLNEQYTAMLAHGGLQADQQSRLIHYLRIVRINELLRKYDAL